MKPAVLTFGSLSLGLRLVFLPVALALLAFSSSADVPRTESGKPDLSGYYDGGTLTPLERPRSFGDRAFMTPEEAAQMSTGTEFLEDGRSNDPNRPPPVKGGDGNNAFGAGNVGGYNAFWLDPGSGVVPIDGKYPTSILIDPPNGQKPATSDAGKARAAGARLPWPRKYPGEAFWLAEGGDPYDNPEGQSLRARCLYFGEVTVPIRPTVYNNMKTIVQSEHHVLIMIEWMHWPRIVRIDSEHLPPDMMSLAGDSIGWWEGDTLIVETTNFLAAPGVPREGLRVVERFSPLDGTRLLYNFTVHDPNLVAPYTGEFPWPKSEKRLYEYACHEGNYSMANTLRGARVLEAKWIKEHGEPN